MVEIDRRKGQLVGHMSRKGCKDISFDTASETIRQRSRNDVGTVASVEQKYIASDTLTVLVQLLIINIDTQIIHHRCHRLHLQRDHNQLICLREH